MAAPVEAATPDRRSLVIVADALELRRAGLVSLLRDWAATHQIEIGSVDPSTGDTPAAEACTCVLVLLNVGSTSVTQPDIDGWLRRFKERFSEAPMVIVSDRDEVEEIVAAFRSGVQGFIPTRTAPDMALQAMSFIISGGSFFPPGALLQPPRRRPGSGAKVERQPPNFTLVHVRPEQGAARRWNR